MSSGPLTENVDWKALQANESGKSGPEWIHNSSWTWLSFEENPHGRSTTSPMISNSIEVFSAKGDCLATWLPDCIDKAVDFLQSPIGEFMSGPEGFLPTAINQDRNLRRTTLATVAVALHLLSEELRLDLPTDISSVSGLSTLKALTLQLSVWLGWSTWTTRLQPELPELVPGLDYGRIDNLDTPTEPFSPHSILELAESMRGNNVLKYHTLAELVRSTDGLSADDALLTKSAAF